MKRSALCAFILGVLFASCGKHNLYFPDADYTPVTPAETELLPGIEPVYADGLVPENYEPMRDDLILPFSVGDTETRYLVNPYSTRTVRLCHDPLCTHDTDSASCPEIFLPAFRDRPCNLCNLCRESVLRLIHIKTDTRNDPVREACFKIHRSLC